MMSDLELIAGGIVVVDITGKLPKHKTKRYQKRKLKIGGYGHFNWSRTNEESKKTWRAHRVAWEFTYGSIPDGMRILHRCDNPACVRPSHLFLGTDADNTVDAFSKGRRKSPAGERHYLSKLTDSDIKEIRSLAGKRGITQRQLAARYGVCYQLISLIVKRHRWKHIS